MSFASYSMGSRYPVRTLTVNTSGTGTGTVNIASGSKYKDGTVISLAATPGGSDSFGGWSGAISGSTTPQNLTMDDDYTVTATFTAAGSTIFSDGFESGDTSAWTVEDKGFSGAGSGVSSTRANEGTFSYKNVYVLDEHLAIVDKTISGSSLTHLFNRWYEWFDVGFDWPNDLKISRIIKNAGGNQMTIGTHHDGVHVWIQSNYKGVEKGFYQGTNMTLPTGQWICFEQEVIMNTPPSTQDGVLRLWIDGVLKQEVTDAFLRDDASHVFEIVRHGGNYSNGGVNPSPTSVRYTDSIVVDTSRINCL